MKPLSLLFDHAAELAGVTARDIRSDDRSGRVSRARSAAVMAAHREGYRNQAIRTFIGRTAGDVRYLRQRAGKMMKSDAEFAEWVRAITPDRVVAVRTQAATPENAYARMILEHNRKVYSPNLSGLRERSIPAGVV
jgi:predicted lipase